MRDLQNNAPCTNCHSAPSPYGGYPGAGMPGGGGGGGYPMPGGGYPMPGGGYPGGPPPPMNNHQRGPIHDASPGYPGAAAANSGGASSWNPRMGPPPDMAGGGYAPPMGGPPTVNGYPGAPGGNWVGGDQNHGAFYSAPMGQPREFNI